MAQVRWLTSRGLNWKHWHILSQALYCLCPESALLQALSRTDQGGQNHSCRPNSNLVPVNPVFYQQAGIARKIRLVVGDKCGVQRYCMGSDELVECVAFAFARRMANGSIGFGGLAFKAAGIRMAWELPFLKILVVIMRKL